MLGCTWCQAEVLERSEAANPPDPSPSMPPRIVGGEQPDLGSILDNGSSVATG